MRTHRVRRLNRTRRNNGGAKLGEGAQAIAYDVYSESDESLYSLTKDKTNKIELFFPDGKTETLSSPEEIEKFLESLKSLTNSIAKVLKPKGFFSFENINKNFIEELDINRTIINLYGLKNAKKYLTLAGIEIHGKSVSAAIFTGEGSKVYAIFNNKCNGNYDMDIKQFATDILESLSHLPSNHNDIKLDNIVRCSDRYKLIDWGKNAPRHKLIRASSTTTNPIKFYLMYKLSTVAKMIFTKMKPSGVHWFNFNETTKTDEFKEIYNKIMAEFQEEIKTNSRSNIMKKFTDTFDVFAFGMTVLYAVIHFKLDFQKYKPLIEALTSLKDPLNAKQGLAFSKKFFKNQ
jgi:hypothetical protein